MALKPQTERCDNALYYDFIGDPTYAMKVAISESLDPSEETGAAKVTRKGVVAKLNVFTGVTNPWDILLELVCLYNLDLNFVLALIAKESAHMWPGHPDLKLAESNGAVGVMQVRHWAGDDYKKAMPSDTTFYPAKIPDLHVPNPRDPVENIQLGLWYLRRVEKWIIEPILGHKAIEPHELAVLASGYHNPATAIKNQGVLKSGNIHRAKNDGYWPDVLQNYLVFCRTELNGSGTSNILENLEAQLQNETNLVYNYPASTGDSKFVKSKRESIKQQLATKSKRIRF